MPCKCSPSFANIGIYFYNCFRIVPSTIYFFRPCVLTKSILHVVENAMEDEQKAFRNQAEIDWKTFLIHRSQELVPGRYLMH